MEKLADRDPSGVALASLVEQHLKDGSLDAAYELVVQGVRKFPNSERIASLFSDVQFRRRRIEIDRELDALQRNRQPARYVGLANLLREVEEWDRAIQILREGIERFPQADGCHLALGEILAERFAKTKSAEDAAAAEKSLETAVSLNARSYRALLSLARLAWHRKDEARAKEIAQRIFALAPGDEFAKSLISEIERGDLPAPSVSPVSSANPANPSRTSVVRESVSTQNVDHLALVELLRRFDRLGGLRGALLVDESGQVVGSRARTQFDEAAVGAFAAALAQRVEAAAEGMSLGHSTEAVLEGENGAIHIMPVADLTLGILVDGAAKPGLVDIVIKEYLRDAKTAR